MPSISIAHRLWFDETLSGATLNFQTGEGAGSILFRVGISTQSLSDCFAHLHESYCNWTIKDQSLCIVGDSEELRITFSTTGPMPLPQAFISLYGEELETFKTVVHGFLCSRQLRLN